MDVDRLLAREFPLEQDLIYLNNAAIAPWPRRAVEAIERLAHANLTSGAVGYPQWQEVEKTLRSQCARLINASPDDIALLKNTSEGLSVVAHGFPWAEGDNIVTSDEEFPSNRIVWESLAPRGVQLRKVAIRRTSDPEQALIEAADRRTRLLAISSVQYASGLRMNLMKLGELCHRHGIAFCVDGIQGLGVIAHDVQAMHIDFMAADAHKWLLGPEGIALFYCHPRWRERLTLHQYGWHMVEALGDHERPDWEPASTARRFECGSPNMLGIHAFSAALSLLLETGIPTVERRTLDRSERLFELLGKQATLDIVTPTTAGRYAGIVTFRHRDRPSGVLYAQLRAHGVACVARGGGIRFSPHFYTPLAQLERAVAFAVA